MPEPTSDAQNQQPAATTAPAADAESIRAQVLQEVFGGKYQTIEDAKKGHWELNNYASQAYQALQTRVNPSAEQSARPSPFQRLKDEAMIPEDAFREAVQIEARKVVREELQPFGAALEAQNQIQTNVPDYVANAPAIQKWMTTQPTTAAKVARLNQAQLYDLAAETAFNAWRGANPPAIPGNEGARQQAQMPGSLSPGQQTMQPAQDPNMLRQALEYSRRTGDQRPAYSMVFPDFEVQLPPHLTDQIRR